jgi:hypothetical protein
MKKYIKTIFVSLLGIFIAGNAIASTNITLTPSTRNVVEGQSFDLIVYANANGVKNGAVEVKIEFPADLLEITSFSQPGAWLLVRQAGDLEDNINGVLLKSSIYTGGFSSDIVFGTVTFTAKKAGVATVSVASDCAAYDVSGKNVYSGNSQSVINISKKTSVSTTVGTASTSTTTDDNSGLTGLEATVGSALDGLFGTSTDDNLTASVFGSMMSGKLGWIIGGIIILGIIFWILFFIKRRKDEEDKNNTNNQ